MSRHLGDYSPSQIIYGKFTTFRPSTGAAHTLAGTPALSVYKDNSATQSTSGVTLTVDFDSVTGLHHFAIDTSADGAFYAAGSNFDVVVTAGTVDSVSVVGTVVASFSIGKVKGGFSPPVMFANVSKDSTTDRVPFYVYDLTGRPATGLTFSAAEIQISENGGAAASSAGTDTEVDATDFPGLYYYVPAAAETDTVGPYFLQIAKAGYISGGAVYEVSPDVGVTNGAYDAHLVSVATNGSGNFNTVRKNTALNAWMFKMVDATDKYTAETGVTVTATRSLDGAAFGACANSAVEVSNGWYKIDLAAADLNANIVVLRFTAAGCAPYEAVLVTNPT